MRVISLNANGLRSAHSKGLFSWLEQQNADIICLQETRVHLNNFQSFNLTGYSCFSHDAIKPGYSGVAVYTKHDPVAVNIGLGEKWIDDEGRYIHLEYQDFIIASVYLPSGSSGEHRQELKYHFMDVYYRYLSSLYDTKPLILCGDFNIAHQQRDIKNWRQNQKSSGFLPTEREWLTQIFNEFRLADAFRVLNQEENQYTWWSFRTKARERNVGWRIDYQIISDSLSPLVKSVNIYKEQYFSDHAPLIIDYDISIKI